MKGKLLCLIAFLKVLRTLGGRKSALFYFFFRDVSESDICCCFLSFIYLAVFFNVSFEVVCDMMDSYHITSKKHLCLPQLQAALQYC